MYSPLCRQFIQISGGGFPSNTDDLRKYGESMKKGFHSGSGMD